MSARGIIMVAALAVLLDRGPKAEAGVRMYDVILEGMDFTTVDPSYATVHECKVTKYNLSLAVLNINFTLHKEFPQTGICSFQLYEKNGNKYSKSSLGIPPANCCQMMVSSKKLYKTVLAFSNYPEECPLLPGHYHLHNYHVKTEYFPPILPTSAWKIDYKIETDKALTFQIIAYARIESRAGMLG